MDRKPKPHRKPRRVGASELAQMAVCERRVLLEHRFGKRNSDERRRAMQRGQRVHRRCLQEGRRGAIAWRWIRLVIDWVRRLLGLLRVGGGR
jgi:hypothetical protein